MLPILLFQLGTFLSGHFRIASGASIFYLTMAIGITLSSWWGPRVALALLLSTWINMWQFDMAFTPVNLLTSLRGPASVLVSWFAYRKLFGGDCRLISVNQLIGFIAFGIFLPITLNASFKFFQAFADPNRLTIFLNFWLPDILTNLALTIPVLLLLSPWLIQKDLILDGPTQKKIQIPQYPGKWYELLVMGGLLVVFHLFLQFERFWFVFGLFSIYASVRFGLRVVATFNLYIYIISYILPYFLDRQVLTSQERFFDTQLGMCLLFLFSLVTARIMKDVRLTREELRRQNELLEKTNQSLLQTNAELDRFVYSVSHDLSAPLKSIKGLVNLSRLESNSVEIPSYLQKIEKSILRLEDFIKEVLDYSRSKRAEVKCEAVQLSQLVDEILQDLKYLEHFPRITINTQLQQPAVTTDRTRLTIILHNLIANAIKYHPVDFRDNPMITIGSKREGETVRISVSDNGAGMPPEIRDRIFDMFFRGSQDSSGSGLGLYIAREAAEKIQASLAVESTVGQGSTFTLTLHANP